VLPGVTQARMYTCPICHASAPHFVKGKRGETWGLECSNCLCGSLVNERDLEHYELQWEEELREILEGLSKEFETDDD